MKHAYLRSAAGLLTLVLTSTALASTTVPLGAGTACVMMSERDAKAMLGLKRRHVLACANPNGTVTRVVVTRKGKVECTDTVQVDGGGAGSVVGTPCAGTERTAGPLVPDVVNLTGAWTSTIPFVGGVCDTQMTQNGETLQIEALCSFVQYGSGYTFSGNGDITFDGFTFDSHGTAVVPIFGTCGDGRMTGVVSPDGQSISGTIACGSIVLDFTAARQ